MSHFKTQIIIPDRQRKVSAFFRVLAPAFFLTILVAFFRVYYTMNGYPAPMLLNIILVLCLCILPLVWWYTWYHNTIEEKGELHLSDNAIELHWNNPHVTMSYPLAELQDLAVIYDGYGGGFFTPYQGTENRLKFVHKGTAYDINFRLASEAVAGEMAQALKTWYEKGVHFADLNSSGEERYLMIYAGQHKQALA
jgi:hypothetical protein